MASEMKVPRIIHFGFRSYKLIQDNKCEAVLCIPATSAPVERIFSHGGLFMRPNRARLGQRLLADLVFTKCNKHLK